MDIYVCGNLLQKDLEFNELEAMTLDLSQHPCLSDIARFSYLRTVGNALPPRHDPRQSINNLQLALEREEVTKSDVIEFWVVNRIIDAEVEAELISILEKAEKSFAVLHFDYDTYAKREMRLFDFRKLDYLLSKQHQKMPPDRQWMYTEHTYHDKNLYAMHNNGARNIMLDIGRMLDTEYILPWDGNCILTPAAWSSLLTDIKINGDAQYLYTPMARSADIDDVFTKEYEDADEEPQIIFKSTALERFHPNYRYGRLPKVEMLLRLRIPGKWDSFKRKSWEPQQTFVTDLERDQIPRAGFVVRMPSGNRDQETDIRNRGHARFEGVKTLLNLIDRKYLEDVVGIGPHTMMYYTRIPEDDASLREVHPVGADVSAWDDKAVPLGASHSHLTLEGARVFQQLVDEITFYALSFRSTGSREHGQRAANIVLEWFGNSDGGPRISPDMQFVCHRSVESKWVRNLKGLHVLGSVVPLLDAVRILMFSPAGSGSFITGRDFDEVLQWFLNLESSLKQQPLWVERSLDINGLAMMMDRLFVSLAVFNSHVNAAMDQMNVFKVRLVSALHPPLIQEFKGAELTEVYEESLMMAMMSEPLKVDLWDYRPNRKFTYLKRCPWLYVHAQGLIDVGISKRLDPRRVPLLQCAFERLYEILGTQHQCPMTRLSSSCAERDVMYDMPLTLRLWYHFLLLDV
eukprot:Clim_evm10s55 gene=Clim_evmTU10s55